MDTHQALNVLNNAVAQLQATREVHQTLNQAVMVLADYIKEEDLSEEVKAEDSMS